MEAQPRPSPQAYGTTGAAGVINAYGPFGEPGLAATNRNSGRLRYTGQILLPEIGLYHYKARTYSPRWGRFLQTDPTGMADGTNLYAYVANDPINGTDPSGTSASWTYANTLGPGTLYDNLLARPFWGGVDSVASSPLGDPGLWMAIEQSSPVGVVPGAVGYGGARIMQAVNGFRSARTAEVEASITGFRGRKGFELKNAPYQPVRNTPGEVNGTRYTGHSFDQMQNRGIMLSIVDNTIGTGTQFPTRAGTTGYYDPINNVRVIVNSSTGRVVTVIRGSP